MAKEKVTDAALRIAGPVIVGMGYELVHLQFVMEGHRWILRFFIDKEGGVGLKDCEKVSREIDTLLEVEDIIDGPYVLEVSSPGLDRPLFKPGDFVRFAGRLAKVKTKEPVMGKKAFLGRISSPTDETFDIVAADGTYTIRYSQVDKARLEIEL